MCLFSLTLFPFCSFLNYLIEGCVDMNCLKHLPYHQVWIIDLWLFPLAVWDIRYRRDWLATCVLCDRLDCKRFYNCFFIWKSNIHICCPYMSLYGYILVLYYAHCTINFDEYTFYFNFTTTFTSYIVITFSFLYHYTFTTS